MGLKKYEIITVGSDKRVRALRSWRVQDRYVNIGDVGGIVYDEKTLSQDGACWLFRGNFGFPGARIGGDSIVDVGETTLSITGAPNADILGSSTVVGAPVRISSPQEAADAVTLTAAYFEQGSINYSAGMNWDTWKTPSTQNIRLKAPVFMGGVSKTIKLDVPGYTVQAFVLDRDGVGLTATASTDTGAGVTLTVPAGQYFTLRLAKNPAAEIVPADATAAQIKTPGTFETKLSIIDSRLEIGPATATGVTIIRPGGSYIFAPGAKYPDSVIRNSKVVINGHTTADRTIRLASEFIGCNVSIDATSGDSRGVGVYSSVNNLTFTGLITASWDVAAHSLIQATDCDNFTVSPTVFPGLAAAVTANMPFIFQGCNVPDGRFYHHAQIKNTYVNIDFAKAQADLGKAIASGEILASSEVEGMYRLYSTTGSVFGALVEAHDSVKSLNMAGGAATYGTTIYKDAYFNGLFDIAGTNVFGNKVRSHPLAQVLNVQPRAVQGEFNTTTVGQTITGVTENANRVCVPVPFRVNGAKGLTINCPTGVEGSIVCTDINGVINALTALVTGESSVPAAQLVNTNAYLYFGKPGGGAITPADLAGVTVTVYNGCKLVNTKATAAKIAGNVLVEDNATLIDTNVKGTGYFGGNSIIQAPSALVSTLPIEGAAYMSDNAVFAPTAFGSGSISLLEMRDNAVFAGVLNTANIFYNITMADNSKFLGSHRSSIGFNMRGNSFVASAGSVESGCRGLLTLKDDARIENSGITAVGCITLCGKYRQTAGKRWTGKRVIASQDAPEYDNNVKTQYDF